MAAATEAVKICRRLRRTISGRVRPPAFRSIDRTSGFDLDRLIVRALVDGEVLQVNVRPGEFVGAPAANALIVLGDVTQLHVRVDIDEYDIPRFVAGAPAKATLKGHPSGFFPLRYVRIEPYVVPKKSLTGENTERVDTRMLQVIYAVDADDPRGCSSDNSSTCLSTQARRKEPIIDARGVAPGGTRLL